VLALKFMPGIAGINVDLDLLVLIKDPTYLASFVIYFLLGYLLYAAVLAGLGSLCNSVKEAQNFMTPVMMLMIVPILAMVPVGKDPNGKLAVVLTYIPPFTPFAMMNRAAGPPATWEYVATTLILLVSIAVAFWGAAKVFRVGILMTGKPPKLSEILRFLRAPVGTIPQSGESS
jgi:ABC-type Na+ efflux pump permease subunit